jgi:dTDP-4-dehydrorhamnose 3,5-epimerase
LETYRKDLFAANGIHEDFVQDNQSLSGKGILRGLHFQAPPHAQGKLVRVLQGRVLDVVVDLRRSSPTYGHWFSLELSPEKGRMFYIPPGFAHGFLTLEDQTIFAYQCTDYYHPPSEGGLRWDDPSLAIDWNWKDPQNPPLVSAKDQILPYFEDFNSPFA